MLAFYLLVYLPFHDQCKESSRFFAKNSELNLCYVLSSDVFIRHKDKGIFSFLVLLTRHVYLITYFDENYTVTSHFHVDFRPVEILYCSKI